MAITISADSGGGTSVVHISGRLTMDGASLDFRDQVNQLIDAGTLNLILVMQDLSYIDSTGLGELVSAASRVTSRGGKVGLVNLSRRVADLLQITKLITVFEVFDDLNGALAAVSTQTDLER